MPHEGSVCRDLGVRRLSTLPSRNTARGMTQRPMRRLPLRSTRVFSREPACLLIIIDPSDRRLGQVAGALAGGGYPDGAQRALAEAEKAVEAKAKPDSFDWSNLTRAAIAVGDLPSAARWMQNVESDDQRADLQTQVAQAQARQSGADAEVRSAMKISDPWVKITALRDTANKQSEAGDSNGAMTTLRLAIEAANRANQSLYELLARKYG